MNQAVNMQEWMMLLLLASHMQVTWLVFHLCQHAQDKWIVSNRQQKLCHMHMPMCLQRICV